jgi:hypothetical protein
MNRHGNTLQEMKTIRTKLYGSKQITKYEYLAFSAYKAQIHGSSIGTNYNMIICKMWTVKKIVTSLPVC